MKRNDMILIGSLFLVGLIGYLVIFSLTNNKVIDDGIAVVYHYDEPILEISLADGSYNILKSSSFVAVDEEKQHYTVLGSNGDVVIEFNKNRVRVIDEISPLNVCQDQGWSSSPLKPITCLPNNIVILVQTKEFIPEDIDVIGG